MFLSENKQKTNTKMAGPNPTIPIIILNANGLNFSIKHQRLLKLYKGKTQPYVIYKRHTSDLKVKKKKG